MSVVLALALFVGAHGLAAGTATATEFRATHLVYEKATKMKKVAATVFLSVVDQSTKNDVPENPRRLRCAALASSKTGPVPVRGEFVVTLLGTDSPALWKSSELSAPVDERGEADFDSQAIADLVGEAAATGAETELFRIEFDGGKGKKVARITIDCIHERTGG